MGISGSQGFIGVATQGPSNTDMKTAPPEGTYDYIEATAAPFQPNDNAQTRRPTIGDNPLPRNAYKVGTSVAGQVGFEFTPDILGKFLYLSMGQADAPVADGDSYIHRIRMNPANQYQIPYFAARRGVGMQILDAAEGCKIAQAVLGFMAGDAAQGAFTFNGRVPKPLASYPAAASPQQSISVAGATSGAFTLVTDEGTTTSITYSGTAATMATNIENALNAIYADLVYVVHAGAEVFTVTWETDAYHPAFTFGANTLDNEAGIITVQELGSGGIGYDVNPLLTVVSETADMSIETSTGVYEGAEDGVISLGAQITWGNALTPPDRYRIGSPFVIDWTLLDRMAAIELRMEIDNPTLFNKVYYGGGSYWDPAPWVGGWSLTATSAEMPFTDGDDDPQPYSITINANSLHYQAMLIANEPQRIVEAVLRASLLKSSVPGTEPLEFIIRTDRATAFA